MPRRVRLVAAVALLAALAPSCAYYNTLYLARKNYYKATDGAPYLVDKSPNTQTQYFQKSVDLCKKVIANYPKSKWVDDAYILWARDLLGQNDPLQTINMLQDFTTRFPNSQLGHEALFFLGVGYRQARKYNNALKCFDEFLQKKPRHDLAPYALLERARVLMALQRPGDAATAAATVLERFPKSKLVGAARQARAEALFARGDFAKAREDFRYLGDHSLTSDDRLNWLLREADCLEGARDFDGSISLLKSALSHEIEPNPPKLTTTPTTPGIPGVTSTPVQPVTTYNPATPDADHYGRLELRIGAAELLAGRLQPALEAFQSVVEDYPRTPLATEAQYRIGYAYETVGDDFDKARAEYAKVKDMGGSGGFTDQAKQRVGSLDRLAQFKTTGADSTERLAETGFMRAEVYLFQLDKPERALTEYRKVAADLKGTPYEAKAMTAEAWVLSRKLDRPHEADSLLWLVVRDHPATEAQLAARDYLEEEGTQVPQDLIKLPEVKLLARADTTALTPPPATDTRLGHAQPVVSDSARSAAPMWQSAMYGTQLNRRGSDALPPGAHFVPDTAQVAGGPRPPGGPGFPLPAMAAPDSTRPGLDPRRGPFGLPVAAARPDSARFPLAPARRDSAALARPAPTRFDSAAARRAAITPTPPDSATVERAIRAMPSVPPGPLPGVRRPARAGASRDRAGVPPARRESAPARRDSASTAPAHAAPAAPATGAPAPAAPAPSATAPSASASAPAPARRDSSAAAPDTSHAAPPLRDRARPAPPAAAPDSAAAAPADTTRSRP